MVRKKQKKMTIESLAGMVQRGFLDTTKTIMTEMNKGFAMVNKTINEASENLRILSENNARDHEELKLRQDNVPYRFEFNDLEKRVVILEKKTGIKK